MPNLRSEDHDSARAYLASLEPAETKAVAPTSGWAAMALSQPMAWSDGGVAPAPGDGPLHLNVVVMICLAWFARNMPVCDLNVHKVGADDKIGDIVDNHPFMDLMNAPCKLDTFHSFMAAIVLSDVVDGNSFIIKLRNNGGKIHSLWWVPPWLVNVIPSPNRDAETPIKSYLVSIGGSTTEYLPEDVVHIKDGIDPFNRVRGISPLKACLRSVSTIDRAELYTQTLMRNCGAIPIMLSPSGQGEEISTQNALFLRDQFAEEQGGYNSGKPFVSQQGLRADVLGVSPDKLGLEKIRDFPVAAICAAIGTPAMAVGLPDAGKTYSNLETAEWMAWRNGLIPRQDRIAEAFDVQCPEMIDFTKERLVWDRSRVSVLQQPVLMRLDGLTKAAGKPVLTRNEARKFLSLPEVDGGDDFETAPPPGPVLPFAKSASIEREDDGRPFRGNQGRPTTGRDAAERGEIRGGQHVQPARWRADQT